MAEGSATRSSRGHSYHLLAHLGRSLSQIIDDPGPFRRAAR